jgi:hypothetical protein
MDEMFVRLKQTDDGTDSGKLHSSDTVRPASGEASSVRLQGKLHPSGFRGSFIVPLLYVGWRDEFRGSFILRTLSVWRQGKLHPSGFRGSFIRLASGEASAVRLQGKLHCSFTICNILPFLPISSLQFASYPSTSCIVTTNSQKLLTLKNSTNTTLSWAPSNHKDDYWIPHSPHCWSKQRNTLAHILLFTTMIPHLTGTHKFFTNPHTPKFHPITICHHPQ